MTKRSVEFDALALSFSRSDELRFRERRAIAFRFFAEFMPTFAYAADFEFTRDSKGLVFSIPAPEAGGSVTVSPRGEPPRIPRGEHLSDIPGDQPPGGGGRRGTGHSDGRYLQGNCPDSVAPDEQFSLHVSVVVGGGDVRLEDFEVPEGGKPLLLEADAPARTAAASLQGDPTWLAYAAYGDSLAKVDTLPDSTSELSAAHRGLLPKG